MIRRTSLSTYKAIQATGVLSFKRMMVYDYLYRNGPLTGGQVQQALGSGVSESIRNRITELVKMGVVYEVKETKCPITGRNVMLFDVTENMPKEYVAPKTKNQIIKELREEIEFLTKAREGQTGMILKLIKKISSIQGMETFKINQYYRRQCEKLKSLILYTDPILQKEECGGDIQLRQWSEFIKCFPEEGKL